MLVVDEVDVMLRLGFGEQVMKIVHALPTHVGQQRRQTQLVSATIPAQIEQFALTLLTDPIYVFVGEVTFSLSLSLAQHTH